MTDNQKNDRAISAKVDAVARAIYEAGRGSHGISRNHNLASVREKADLFWSRLHETKPMDFTAVVMEARAAIQTCEAFADPWNRDLSKAPKDGTRVDLWVKDSAKGYRIPDCRNTEYFGETGWWFDHAGQNLKLDEANIIAWRPVPDGPQS